jgi:uncharacterized membrane protein
VARFTVYGSLGLCAEVVFTAAHDSLRARRVTLRGRTSLWMFPVYGLAQPLFEPAHEAMRDRLPAPIRAIAYAAGFLAVEYVAGRAFVRVRGRAPWDYSHAGSNIGGLTRLDYAPFWAAAGLALERVHDRLAGR